MKELGLDFSKEMKEGILSNFDILLCSCNFQCASPKFGIYFESIFIKLDATCYFHTFLKCVRPFYDIAK